MSTGPENNFISSVHQHLPPMGELYRMKNHNQFNGGIADVWYSGRRADFWIEYKFITVPKRDATPIDLIHKPPKGDSVISSLQQEWLRNREDEGRNVGVIVGCKEGGVWFAGVNWDRVYHAGDFINMLRTRQELATLITTLTT